MKPTPNPIFPILANAMRREIRELREKRKAAESPEIVAYCLGGEEALARWVRAMEGE